jgi:hypothetical protein
LNGASLQIIATVGRQKENIMAKLKKRLSGEKNYLYFASRGAQIISGSLSAGTNYLDAWYKIVGKAATASGLPATAVAGDVFYAAAAVTLATGDVVQKFTLTAAAFVTNVPGGKSKEKYENTVQLDDDKSYVEGDKSEKTGTINGYWITNEDQVKLILSRFYRTVSYIDDSAVFSGTKTGTVDFFLMRNSKQAEGEEIVVEYMPAIIDSITVDKPMEGNQTLDFAYTGIGSERPSVHFIPVEA